MPTDLPIISCIKNFMNLTPLNWSLSSRLSKKLISKPCSRTSSDSENNHNIPVTFTVSQKPAELAIVLIFNTFCRILQKLCKNQHYCKFGGFLRSSESHSHDFLQNHQRFLNKAWKLVSSKDANSGTSLEVQDS